MRRKGVDIVSGEGVDGDVVGVGDVAADREPVRGGEGCHVLA